MIIPEFWAEARRQQRANGRQVTVRRFGWSNTSQAEAEALAEERADAAIENWKAGAQVPRREPKVPYNGAEGIPIREEVLARYGETVVTRNSYGAQCLNTPDVLFADVDLRDNGSCLFVAVVTFTVVAAVAVMARTQLEWPLHWSLVSGLAAGFFGGLPLTVWLYGRVLKLRGGLSAIALQRITRFFDTHRDWSGQLYRTPNGFRVVAVQRLFSPGDPEVVGFFAAIQADPVYVRMCQRQQCFRARLTAKPWRIGIATHLAPRPGVWPLKPERLPERRAWVAEYERQARAFAACAFLQSFGTAPMHAGVREVVDLHDRLSQARSGLPLA